ncbi:hypothetical protein ACWC24_39210 [Streptomyces sp. NPDC001443]
MTDGFPNKPRILRGAFVEFGLSVPPLAVVFQFNPVQLSRNRALTYAFPGVPGPTAAGEAPAVVPQRTLRQVRGEFSDLLALQREQLVNVQDQTIAFDLRLDATDRLDDRDPVAERFGVGPQLSTLELMVYPKDESLLGSAAGALLGEPDGFSFTRSPNPPVILFIFGRKRVLPVNITAMNITETEFSADLNPVRATVSVNLTVIEGDSVPYLYSKAMVEAMSALNVADATGAADVVVPG